MVRSIFRCNRALGRLFYEQIYNEGDCHADAANADESLDELVALFALCEAAEVAAEPRTCCHDEGDENLYKADTDLHNATVNGDAEKAECSFNRELFWWNLWRLAENVFAQVAHHDDKANDDRENRLKELVSDADQKTRTKGAARIFFCSDSRDERDSMHC